MRDLRANYGWQHHTTKKSSKASHTLDPLRSAQLRLDQNIRSSPALSSHTPPAPLRTECQLGSGLHRLVEVVLLTWFVQLSVVVICSSELRFRDNSTYYLLLKNFISYFMYNFHSNVLMFLPTSIPSLLYYNSLCVLRDRV